MIHEMMGELTVDILISKMILSRMMKSAQESDATGYPCSICIDATEQFIDEKLSRLLKHETALGGGVDMMRLNGQLRRPGDRIENVLATGGEVTHHIEPGFSIHLTDGEAGHDWSITARAAEDCVRLRFAATGDAQYQADQGSLVDEDSACTFIVQPAGASLTANYRRDVVYRYCSIDVSRAFLTNRLGMCPEQIPAYFTSSWARQEVAFGRIALDRPTLSLLLRLFALRSEEVWARLESQAIGLLVIAQLFSAWREPQNPPAVLFRLKLSERAALVHLRTEADRRCPNTISMVEAQSISGLNRNKIHYGFKQMFGVSLQRYCTDLRLRLASELLLTTTLPIAEIAAKAGFSEPTNFTAAFRQHTGQLPSSFRSARGKAGLMPSRPPQPSRISK